MSNSLKVQSLALCLPLTLLLACGQNDSKKKNEAPLVQKDAPAEPAPAPAPVEPTVRLASNVAADATVAKAKTATPEAIRNFFIRIFL